MIISCPHCQKRLEVDNGTAGSQVACPECHSAFTVPAVGAAVRAGGSGSAAAMRRPAAAGGGGAMVVLAKVSLIIGLLVVVAARSCENIGARVIARAQAKYTEARMEEKTEGSKLEALQDDVNEARMSLQMNGLWFELLFMIGTILLLLGLVGVGFGGSGAERLVALVMIAIITFSIYFAGAAWLGSILNTIMSMTR